jgi:hypothetical protein
MGGSGASYARSIALATAQLLARVASGAAALVLGVWLLFLGIKKYTDVRVGRSAVVFGAAVARHGTEFVCAWRTQHGGCCVCAKVQRCRVCDRAVVCAHHGTVGVP